MADELDLANLIRSAPPPSAARYELARAARLIRPLSGVDPETILTMWILGISCYYHDAGAAILRDGELVAAAEEERFTRRKHDNGFPSQAIRFCLAHAQLAPHALDYVVFYEKPFRKFERILKTVLATAPGAFGVFQEAMLKWAGDRLWVQERIAQTLGIGQEKILFADHHLCHAASAYFCSPFDEAATLTVDGVGEWNTATIGEARGNEIRILREMQFPHSVGLLYSTFTAFLGFEVNEGEYKVMGLAPYGQPRYVDKILQIVKIFDDGSLWLDLRYFDFYRSTRRSFSQRFIELFGPPRDPREADRPEPYYADLAASIQRVTEEILLKMAREAYRLTNQRRLCFAGGVAFNSAANWRILNEGPFENLYVQPAAGDAGGALGAALLVYHQILGHPRRFVMRHASWGQAWSEEEIRRELARLNVAYDECPDEEELVRRTAEALAAGKVVGWVQGRFEWGPRALGHRSILADPRRAEMKDLVNRKIKFREPFRPFAPSVIAEAASAFVPASLNGPCDLARFMLAVSPVPESARLRIPAVVHVDGSARFQVVFAETNPLYHRLISRFGELTGVPVVLNTSFNLRGEPIASSPDDALSTFMRSGLDLLVMGRCVVSKR